MTTFSRQRTISFDLYAGCWDSGDIPEDKKIKLDPRLKVIIDRHFNNKLIDDDDFRTLVEVEGLFWPDLQLLQLGWWKEVLGMSGSVEEAIETSIALGILLKTDDQFTAVPVYGDIKDFTVLEE